MEGQKVLTGIFKELRKSARVPLVRPSEYRR